jgi:glutathione S-transferase
MQLFIGNKNYSSWSMRPWVLMRHFGLPFEEVRLRFDSFAPGSDFKRGIARVSPAGRVPALVEDDGAAVWDSLAICERLAELFPDRALWPRADRPRARARSVSAEMHAGFGALREHCPMNIEAALPDVGARVMAGQAGVRADLARLAALWLDALAASGGPFLFGDFCIADAFFAPVASRLRTYALPVAGDAEAYAGRVLASPGVAAWIADALAERDFLAFEEPYRSARD